MDYCSLFIRPVLEAKYVECVMNVLCFDSPYPRTPEIVMLYPIAPSLDIWLLKRIIDMKVARTPFEQPRTCKSKANTFGAELVFSR